MFAIETKKRKSPSWAWGEICNAKNAKPYRYGDRETAKAHRDQIKKAYPGDQMFRIVPVAQTAER